MARSFETSADLGNRSSPRRSPIRSFSLSRNGSRSTWSRRESNSRSGLIAVWIPFVAADVGSFFAGGVSGYLVKRGWSLGAARKVPIIYGGIGMTLLIPTIFTTNLYSSLFYLRL